MPRIGKFTVNADRAAAGEARATAYHTSEAPRLDVRYRELGATSRIKDVGAKALRNSEQGFPDLLEGDRQYEVLVSETRRLRSDFRPPVFEQRFPLEAQSTNLFLIVGSLPNDTLRVIQVAIEIGTIP